jgi:peptidoglycan/xylan/chitin deacetylase (PgdA/CDA1 family)
MARDLRSGSYPPFVTSDSEPPRGIPLFVFHSPSRGELEARLRFLASNSYETLFMDELLADPGRRSESFPKRRVVLTFDDGRRSLYEKVYPLLRTYSAKAVAYIIPAWIGHRGFIGWDEVREMHESGRVDFQSHSLSHRPIPVSPRVVDFVSPADENADPWDIPTDGDPGDRRDEGLPLGRPVFCSASRCSDRLRYLGGEEMVRLCLSYVSERGGPRFFREFGWRRRLFSLARRHAREGDDSAYETEEQRREAIRREFAASKEFIEANLPGKTVRHFCFPWNETGDVALQMARECGYASAAAGMARPEKDERRADPFRLARVNGDFVLRLPGTGQRSFLSILLFKARRRMLQGRSY